MANFQVELPDGRKFKVEGVADPEAAYAAIEQMMAQQTGQQTGQQQPAAAQPEQPERYVDPNASRGMFAVDRAQTLAGNAIEGTGRFIEQAVPAVGGPMAQYGRSVVEKNEADIARRGYQSTYQGSFLDQEGAADKLGWTGEKMVENSIPTLATYGGYAAAALTAPYSVPIATLIAGLTTVGTVGMGIGETTDELKSKVSEDDYNPNAAVIGGTIVGLLDRFGASKALGISKDKLLTMSLDEITAALRKAGKGKIAKNIMRGMAVEGATEAAQENVIMGTAATQGAEYTGKEVLDRNIDSAVLGAAMGGAMTATTETAGKATRLFKDDGSIEDIENLTREHQQAAATFARRLDKIATGGDLNGNTFDLQDIDKMSQTGARAVVEAAHTDLVGEIVDKAGDLKELLRKSDQDTFDQRFKKVRAAVAQKMARNKTKSVVTAENFLALEDLVGGYTEGQALMNLIRESQIMTEVHNNDYQGKLSKFTDMFSVLGGGTGYDKSAVAVERVVRPIASLSFGLNTSGLSLLGQQAVASIGQRLDKARGTYSSVDKFIKENKDKAGLPAPRPPSFRDQRLQQAQQASTTRAGLQAYNDKKDGGDNINSPVGSILAGTGLSPDGLNKLLDYIETAPDTTPDVMVYVDQTRRNLAGEGNSIDDISPWIQAINGTLNESEELDALREDQPDNPLAQRARRRAGFGPSTAQSSAGTAQQQPQGRSAAVQSGIDDNRAQLEKLRQGLAANTSLTPAERGRLLTALDTLEYNLGSDPAVAAMDVVSKLKSDGISESLINRHIMPYVERVLQQQARSGRRQQPPSTGNTDLSFDEDFDASKPALTDNVPTGEVSGVPLETYLPRAYDIAKREVFKTGRDLKLAIQKRSLQAQRSSKINLREMTPINEDRLADFAVADALEALKTNLNAIGWYDKTVSEALSQMAQVFPEIATDPKAKLQFVWALAATSNGTKVNKNLELAGIAYEHLQKTGRFPTDIGIGKAAKAIRSGLQMYHTMLDKFNGDHAALEQFSNSQFTVKDLEERYGIPISGEGANETVRGAAVLGPKIGNGFFSNLYGNFDALTIDRWNMRTVGRWRGDLVVINKKMIKKKRDELWSILSSMSDEDMQSLRKLYKGTRTKLSNTVMSDRAIDKWANATAKLSQDPDWRNLINDLGFEEVRKKGNGLFGYLDGQREAPSGPTERAFIRRVFEKALDRLNNDPTVLALPSSNRSNQPLNMSDLQALLWYPEKLLYDTAKKPVGEESKGYKDDEAPDYANAARKFVNNRQANSQRGRLGLTNGTRGRGRGAGTSNDGPNGQPTSFDQEPAGILRSEQANDRGRGRSRRDAGGQLTPLENAPVLRGHKGPIQNLVKVVEKYAAENNIPYVAQGEFVNVDPAFGARVAEAYDQMKDQPNDPAVKAAYADMIRQTKAQYDALVQDGYTFFFIDPTSGYGDSPVTALEDLRLNKRMGIFPTDEGYGSDEDATFDDNPLLEKSGETWVNEDGSPKDVLYNDLFRAVHDAFGHGLEGSGFRARGEENAFQAHIRLFVGPARGAMTSETRGQNSYLNYGPHGENNQTASVEDTKFADQKIGVMPSWTWSENIAPDEMIEQSFDQDLAGQNAGALTQQPQQQSPFNMKALVNKMLGSQPATPEQIKAQLPEVRALFEIGKKGSKYENGIQNLDDALVLADALGLTVRMFDVQQDMMDAVGVNNRVRGVFRSSTKEVFGLKAGTTSDALGTITDLEALTTMLHEIGHGMAAGVGPTEQSTLLELENDMNSDATMALNSALTPENQRSNKEYALSGSFESAMFPHLAIDYTGRGSKIQQEVINLQENIEVYLEKNPKQTRKVRKILQVKDNAVRDGSGLARLEFIRHLQYVRGNREFAVDPLWVYMANPKLARAVMPMTTALIKKHFKDAQSTDIQFFAHPLAVSLAVVLAMMLNGRAEEEEEEQQRQQMPAGALSTQAGALSQQQQAA